MGFAESFTNGIRAGSALAGTWSDINARDRLLQWKQEDRDQEQEDRKQLMELGAVVQKFQSGDPAPAIALANSKGWFGEGKFAAGAQVDDKGNWTAQVYDTSDPVGSMTSVPMGTSQNITNKLVMANLPQRYLGQILAQQQAKYMDPAAQAQLQGMQADAQAKAVKARVAPQQAQLGLAKGQADIAHTNAQTDFTQANTAKTQALTPAEASKAQAEADLMRARASNPTWGKPLGTATTDEYGTVIRRNLYPGDPALQTSGGTPTIDYSDSQAPAQAALAGLPLGRFISPDKITQATGLTGGRALAGPSLGGAGQATGQTAGQASGQTTFASADEVKAAYKSGRITKEQAISILRQQFRMQ